MKYVEYDEKMYSMFRESFTKEDAPIDELRGRLNNMFDILISDGEKEPLFHVMSIICLDMLTIASEPDDSND